ncbi:MAG TPA: fused MFS/spermidine synthase [Methylomirabilota bacterium]|nr:fused MFS/spermidine synthase [Methylomirabilota bacterium]
MTGLYATSFVSGAAIMLLEILGFRLLPPYFGYSMAVWGALLGVVLAALAVGYYAGGALADRHPYPRTLYLMILLAAGYTLLVLQGHPAMLGFAARFELVPGVTLAALLLLALPMTALSTVSPLLIRLLAAQRSLGSAAGTVYAVSTAGSLAGTLVASFYLVPTVGTRASLWVAVLTLAFVGTVGFLQSEAGGRARDPA